MPRPPKPYRYRGNFCTNFGGIPHQVLCPENDGLRAAERALLRLQDRKADDPEEFAASSGAASKKFVHEVIDEYLTLKKANGAENTYLFYRDKLEPFRDRFGLKRIRSITAQDAAAYKVFLQKEKTWVKGKRLMHGYGPTTTGHCLRCVRMLYKWAAKPRRRYVNDNPFDEITVPKAKERERIISNVEFQHLLDNCASGNHTDGARDFREQLLLMRNTGMRPGEQRLLRWTYVDLESHTVRIPDEFVKTRRRRQFALNELAEQVLQTRRARLKKEGRKLSGYVFPGGNRSDPEKMMKHNSFSQRFWRLFNRCVAKGLIQKEKAGERICLYSARHSRITDMVRAKMPQKAVMDEAGHVTPAMTHKYTHLADEEQTNLARSVPQVGQLPQ